MRHAAPMRAGLLSLAALQGAIGLWQAISPGTFYTAFANFGARSDHMTRDVSTYYLASAVVLYLAVSRPSWRAPALALVGLQYALHALNHLKDIANASPGWVGPFDFVSVAAGAATALWLCRVAQRDEETRA